MSAEKMVSCKSILMVLWCVAILSLWSQSEAVVDGIRQVGDNCSSTLDCKNDLGQGAVCTNSQCGCDDKYHTVQGACWKSIEIGGRCVVDEDCSTKSSSCVKNPPFGICSCPPNRVYYNPNDTCVTYAGYKEKCRFNSQCQEQLNLPNVSPLECRLENGTYACLCKPNFEFNFGSCMPSNFRNMQTPFPAMRPPFPFQGYPYNQFPRIYWNIVRINVME